MQLIFWHKWPKDMVQSIKKDAVYAAPLLGATVCHAAKVIDVSLKMPSVVIGGGTGVASIMPDGHGTELGGSVVSAMQSSWCGGGQAPCIICLLVTLATVLVWAQKYGGELTQPIGSTSGKATKCSLTHSEGKTTLSFGMSSACSQTQ